ncbi:hypothetical protein [Streptomyces sp. Da 82-17]|uniref:hypothetical protein n=1 Tax=Streptomyces sp. Da 82-17 TaxID=3377116 RepID=UPI0038D4BE43
MTTNWTALQKRLDTLKRPTLGFTICEDPEVRHRLNRAKTAVADAEQTLTALTAADEPQRPLFEDRAAAARAELAAAQEAFDKAAITLTFQALERRELEDLQAKHPASEQDEADGQDFAMDSFAPALIAAASVDGMPVDYAKHCLDTWSAADARGLWNAAWSVQHQQRTDLGKG